MYPVIFGIVTLIICILVANQWADTPTVAIEFNVGEIIGGLLVGISAVFASLTYARGRD